MKIKTITFQTKYWRPGTDYIFEVINTISPHIQNGDIVVVSEKAISTATGNMIDESEIEPGKMAKFLANTWTRKMWVKFLGKICRLKPQTLENLKNYPGLDGSRHKEVALRYAGFLQSLRHYSEGGIDASNLPYSYVSLPLTDPVKNANKIKEQIANICLKNVTVIIGDGDTTYSWRNLHLAPRKISTPGLIHFGGFLTFVIGRMFNLKERQTPITISGENINPDRLLWLTQLFHKLSGGGAGRTVWSMAEKMETEITGITYEMLESVPHFPITIIRIIN
jgi:F420-0:gamma-glutamyl ligase-like protein